MKSLHIFIFLIMFQEYRKQSRTCVLKLKKKLLCFDVGFDPGLPQAKQACKSTHLWYPVLLWVLLPYPGCCIRKYPSAPAIFQGLFVVLSLTAGRGDTVMSPSILWKQLRNFATIPLKLCSWIFYKVQNRNTSLIRTFHSFKKHELLCARF